MTKNIVLITADSLRWDYISYFNTESPAITPNLDRLASEGYAFHRAVANGPRTIFSVPSLLTGEYYPAISTSTPTVAELLSEAGYQTGAFCTNIQIIGPDASHMELTRGFDTFDTCLNLVREKSEYKFEKAAHGLGYVARKIFGSNSMAYKGVASATSFLPTPLARPTPHAEHVNTKALNWLDRLAKRNPFFLWLFHLDTHEPWLPPDDWLPDEEPSLLNKQRYHGVNRKFRYFKDSISENDIKILEQLYVSCVEYWDREIGELIDSLTSRGFEDTVILITSDHGELFGEYGELGHVNKPYDELLRVPLILWDPDLCSTDEHQPVQNLDVANTIAEIANCPTPTSFRGSSLLSPRNISRDGVLSIIDTNPIELSFFDDDWQYVRSSDDEEIYRSFNTTGCQITEVHNSNELKKNYSNKLDSIIDDVPLSASSPSEPPRGERDEKLEERLRALGYLDGKR